MTKILLTQEYTSQKDLEKCVAAFEKIRKVRDDARLEIEAELELKEIDIQLVAYLMLFKTEIPELQITLKLPFNDKNLPDRELEYKIKQYGTYAYLLTGQSIFQVFFGAEKFDFNFQQAYQFPETNCFVLSKYFVLLLYVHKDETALFDQLFEKTLHSVVGKPLKQLESDLWHINTDTLYGKINRFLTRTAIPKERFECIQVLGRLAFYNALNEAKILSIYLDTDYRSDPSKKRNELHAGSFSSGKAIMGVRPFHQYGYYEQIIPVFDEIAEHSLAHQFIFSTLISSEFFVQTTVDRTTMLLQNLWGFTKELVYGLRELAKNLREHTSNNRGVITTRIYDTGVFKSLQQLDPGSKSMFEHYLEHLGQQKATNVPAFLDINIIDTGILGIIPTLLKSSKETYDKLPERSSLKKLFLQDIDQLRGVEFTVKNLLDPGKNLILNQQVKRSIAHLGLMLFNKLITKNQGLLILSSRNPVNERDTIISPESIQLVPAALDIGTHYRVILPVQPEKPYQTHLPEINLPGESSAADIKGLEELFAFQHYLSPNDSVTASQKTIFTLKPANQQLTDRTDEIVLWDAITEIKAAMDTGQSPHGLYNLDVSDLGLDGSQLFRLLGHWQAEFPKSSLVPSNITTDLFLQLVNINGEYISNNRDMDYWNAVAAILVYHYSLIRSDRFYFADVLWGKTRTEYRVLNKMVARTNFNYTAIFLQQKASQEKNTGRQMRPNNLAFYNQNVLLPLDILLKAGDMTFFEYNSLVLLKNEIKPKTFTRVS